ncbi:hypothetical protein TSAR_008453 [Trichomalopsis sarcophagae]|uniref:Uncharacterized protein n=1 Tax=Trichomalopsis sarcophagae TaxID=543379 RepID=A0A232F7Y3_9HYME|nr:hypothetical protein TSAR_008453 [Trichomalopsis sarcophagae]
MSFGGGFGSSTPAASSAFSFGTATSSAATPIKPDLVEMSVILGIYHTLMTLCFGTDQSLIELLLVLLIESADLSLLSSGLRDPPQFGSHLSSPPFCKQL